MSGKRRTRRNTKKPKRFMEEEFVWEDPDAVVVGGDILSSEEDDIDDDDDDDDDESLKRKRDELSDEEEAFANEDYDPKRQRLSDGVGSPQDDLSSACSDGDEDEDGGAIRLSQSRPGYTNNATSYNYPSTPGNYTISQHITTPSGSNFGYSSNSVRTFPTSAQNSGYNGSLSMGYSPSTTQGSFLSTDSTSFSMQGSSTSFSNSLSPGYLHPSSVGALGSPSGRVIGSNYSPNSPAVPVHSTTGHSSDVMGFSVGSTSVYSAVSQPNSTSSYSTSSYHGTPGHTSGTPSYSVPPGHSNQITHGYPMATTSGYSMGSDHASTPYSTTYSLSTGTGSTTGYTKKSYFTNSSYSMNANYSIGTMSNAYSTTNSYHAGIGSVMTSSGQSTNVTGYEGYSINIGETGTGDLAKIITHSNYTGYSAGYMDSAKGGDLTNYSIDSNQVGYSTVTDSSLPGYSNLKDSTHVNADSHQIEYTTVDYSPNNGYPSLASAVSGVYSPHKDYVTDSNSSIKTSYTSCSLPHSSGRPTNVGSSNTVIHTSGHLTGRSNDYSGGTSYPLSHAADTDSSVIGSPSNYPANLGSVPSITTCVYSTTTTPNSLTNSYYLDSAESTSFRTNVNGSPSIGANDGRVNHGRDDGVGLDSRTSPPSLMINPLLRSSYGSSQSTYSNFNPLPTIQHSEDTSTKTTGTISTSPVNTPAIQMYSFSNLLTEGESEVLTDSPKQRSPVSYGLTLTDTRINNTNTNTNTNANTNTNMNQTDTNTTNGNINYMSNRNQYPNNYFGGYPITYPPPMKSPSDFSPTFSRHRNVDGVNVGDGQINF
eukprot:TRINITY_DN10064_c3_g1_i1.p1 TRINITY_DN10064_c3_g1~~TRINITY_DN10064_c3_g1_i1.p1  ORF type:complete len:837 (-),score=119.42 TRINITY_DN10064_c3_g1_i1:237-2687(-)